MSHARRAAYAIGLLARRAWSSPRPSSCATPSTTSTSSSPSACFGLSPTADQIRAALIMAAEQMLTLLTAAALLMWSHVDRATAEREAAAGAGVPSGSGRGVL